MIAIIRTTIVILMVVIFGHPIYSVFSDNSDSVIFDGLVINVLNLINLLLANFV